VEKGDILAMKLSFYGNFGKGKKNLLLLKKRKEAKNKKLPSIKDHRQREEGRGDRTTDPRLKKRLHRLKFN